MSDFLDKVKQGIDKGVAVVSVRSKEALEAARIKGRIGALAEEKKNALEEIGSLVYTLHLHGGHDFGGDVSAKCAAVTELDGQIKEKEDEMQRVHREASVELGIPVCISCGDELSEDDMFCRKCGTKVG